MSNRQFALQLSFALCEGIQIPESKKIFACGIRNPKFLLVESTIRSFQLESGIQLKESGIPLKIRIQNPSSPVPWIRNPRRGILNTRLSWTLGWSLTGDKKTASCLSCYKCSWQGRLERPQVPYPPTWKVSSFANSIMSSIHLSRLWLKNPLTSQTCFLSVFIVTFSYF